MLMVSVIIRSPAICKVLQSFPLRTLSRFRQFKFFCQIVMVVTAVGQTGWTIYIKTFAKSGKPREGVAVGTFV